MAKSCQAAMLTHLYLEKKFLQNSWPSKSLNNYNSNSPGEGYRTAKACKRLWAGNFLCCSLVDWERPHGCPRLGQELLWGETPPDPPNSSKMGPTFPKNAKSNVSRHISNSYSWIIRLMRNCPKASHICVESSNCRCDHFGEHGA